MSVKLEKVHCKVPTYGFFCHFLAHIQVMNSVAYFVETEE